MKKGELIVECIKLMYGNDEQLEANTISSNPDYEEYTVNVIGSINRALQRIQDLGKLPKKTFAITKDLTDREDYAASINKKNKSYYIYNLPSLIKAEKDDVYQKVERVEHIDSYYNEREAINIQTQGYGQLCLLPLEYDNESYLVTYTAMINLVTDDMDDSDELPYPNVIYQYIPYFVKADRYEEENPSVASLNRNIFESYVANMLMGDEDQCVEIENYYKL